MRDLRHCRIKIFAASLVFLLVGGVAYSASESTGEAPSFSGLKSILDNDLLSEQEKKKNQAKKERIQRRKQLEKSTYRFPRESDFWGFFSELWLVKNARWLKWDRKTPKYGFDSHFKELLERLGFFHHQVRILFHQSPQIAHLALPAGENRTIFLLSIPFLRTSDLTKMDVSLLLLEDLLRVQESHLKSSLDTKKVRAQWGKNFFGKKEDVYAPTNDLVAQLSVFLKEKGFSFQQQHDVTRKMDSILKSHPRYWSSYFQLLQKLDKLSEQNSLYKNLSTLYPSPKMQLTWLTPPKEIL